MKLVKFVKNQGKIKWGVLFDNIRLNIEKGNCVVVGSKEDIKIIEDLIGVKEE